MFSRPLARFQRRSRSANPGREHETVTRRRFVSARSRNTSEHVADFCGLDRDRSRDQGLHQSRGNRDRTGSNVIVRIEFGVNETYGTNSLVSWNVIGQASE
ncbi:hypothetical protein ANTRET_LOCUS8294 [Anthophora retusa]